MGLREFVKKENAGKRQGNWGNPNDKALANLQQRQKEWDAQSSEWKEKTTRPGSMKLP